MSIRSRLFTKTLLSNFKGNFRGSVGNNSPVVTDLYTAIGSDSIGQRTFDETTEFNTEAELYFDSSDIFDVANGGAYLTKSTAFAVDGGAPTNFVIDDSGTPILSTQALAQVAAISEVNRALINTLFFCVGTNDCKDTALTKAHFKTNLTLLYDLYKAQFPALQKVIVAPIHRCQAGTQNAAYQNAREAIFEICAEQSRYVLGNDFWDVDHTDTIHPTTAEFAARVAPRGARGIAQAYGKTTNIQPFISNPTFDSNIVTCPITLPQGQRLEIKPNAQYINRAPTNGLVTLSGFTFVLSGVFDILDEGVPAINQRMFIHQTSGNDYISLFWNSNGNMILQVRASGGVVQQTAFFNSSTYFTDSGNYVRVGFSFDASGNALIYCNGDLVDSKTYTSVPTGTVTDHYIFQTATGTQVYTGTMRDYSLYNTALTADQLAAYTGTDFTDFAEFFRLDGNGTLHTPTAVELVGSNIELTFPASSAPRRLLAGYGTQGWMAQVNPIAVRDNGIVPQPLKTGVFTLS